MASMDTFTFLFSCLGFCWQPAGRGRGLQPAVHGVLWERKELPVLCRSLLPHSTAGNQLKNHPAPLQPWQELIPPFAAIPLKFPVGMLGSSGAAAARMGHTPFLERLLGCFFFFFEAVFQRGSAGTRREKLGRAQSALDAEMEISEDQTSFSHFQSSPVLARPEKPLPRSFSSGCFDLLLSLFGLS